MISVIIPAHNESEVIARTLRALAGSAGALDIVVVANGCSDDTAARARAFDGVRVIETPVAGKPHALNLGDQASRFFPRIYADADVTIARGAVEALAARLTRGDVLAAAPRPAIDLSGCSFAVRAFYDIRARMPQTREGIGGSGVYALSEAGRRRFGEFPGVISDDGFVRIQFTPAERVTLSEAVSVVHPPRRLADLIATRARIHHGNYELKRLYPELWTNKGADNESALVALARNPLLWGKLAIYVAVTLLAKRAAKARIAAGRNTWERDASSRGTGAGAQNATAGPRS